MNYMRSYLYPETDADKEIRKALSFRFMHFKRVTIKDVSVGIGESDPSVVSDFIAGLNTSSAVLLYLMRIGLFEYLKNYNRKGADQIDHCRINESRSDKDDDGGAPLGDPARSENREPKDRVPEQSRKSGESPDVPGERRFIDAGTHKGHKGDRQGEPDAVDQ